MATLKDAERAREQTAEYLREQGAHAISVEEEPVDEPPEGDEDSLDAGAAATSAGRRRRRRRRFAVVAWFADDPPPDLPERLEIATGKTKRVVPLRTRREERFQAE